jgi:hypothetical protein
MASSGTYEFANVKNADIYDNAYQNLGIKVGVLVPEDIILAQTCANFILSSWINNGLNLWTVSQNNLLTLVQYKTQYDLPSHCIDILEASVRQSTRVLGGTPSASSGTAANAFDGNPKTTCAQSATNGNISYNYGNNNSNVIYLIGIQSYNANTLTLSVEYSDDGASWNTLFNIPATTYTAKQLYWYNVENPVSAQYYRIRETGGATLSIAELYFNNNITDIIMDAVSRSEYLSFPNKTMSSIPIQYKTNRTISPTLTIYPSPSAQYQTLVYNYKRAIQDIGSLLDTPDVPQRFFEALTWGIAWRLSISLKPELVSVIKQEYQNALNLALQEDVEKNVSFNIKFDYSSFEVM